MYGIVDYPDNNGVWGTGKTPAAAVKDALYWLGETDYWAHDYRPMKINQNLYRLMEDTAKYSSENTGMIMLDEKTWGLEEDKINVETTT